MPKAYQCANANDIVFKLNFTHSKTELRNVFMKEVWDYPGSKWWKFDFHTHTPKSNDYGRGDESLKCISTEEWLQSAMKASLDCVVVTDHNSGEWIDALQKNNSSIQALDIKPEWYHELTIYPGVEITVAGSNSRIHLLALFSPNCNGSRITAMLGQLGILTNFGDEKTISTTTSFSETVKRLHDAGGLAIPAHIDGLKGLLEGLTTLTPDLQKSLRNIDAAEYCNLHAFDQSERQLSDLMNSYAKIAGSDAHRPDEIGRYFSWLKMSIPSIEGLRLALDDYEYCVKNQANNPNYLPEVFIKELTVQNMRHCGRIPGRPFCMELHPHFNTVIGGRGTGKSTILESVRIAFRRDQSLALEAPRVKEELDKFMKLSQNKGVMLTDTEIKLVVQRRGKDFRLRWRYDGQGTVLEEQNLDGWQAIETGDIKDRFPVSIYSQKQINEMASNPRGLLEVVDRAPEVDHNEWKNRWEGEKSRYLQLCEKKRELDRMLAVETQIRTNLSDVENDLKQYEEKGHGEILKQYQKRVQQFNSIPDDQIFDELSANIRELSRSSESSDFPMHLFDSQDDSTPGIQKIHELAAQELKSIGVALESLADRVLAYKVKRAGDIAASKWFQAYQTSVTAYEGLIKEYEQKSSHLSISVYGEWVQKRNQLQQQFKKLASVRMEIGQIEKQITEVLSAMQGLRGELVSKRRHFLEHVIGTNGYVRMELVPYGDTITLEEDYRAFLNLDSNKFASSVLDYDGRQGLLYNLVNWEDRSIPETKLPELIENIKTGTRNIANGLVAGNHGAFDNRLKKILETQPGIFDQLDAWWPEDLLRVRFAKEPATGKFEDLEKGSAGQKAAAILAFLLSHGNEPLVMDQPEDDLDNALVSDLIVRQIHENKNRRQILIVTHNPNIVVNGDSELVHILKFDNGQVQIDKQGGLEEAGIRESICTIMEGGRKAFDKRYKRITMEDSHV